MTPKLLIDSLLPSPLTPIHDLLTPVTIFRTRDESYGFQVFGNGSPFILNPPSHLVGLGAAFELFPVALVREIHLGIRHFNFCGEYVSYFIDFLPALEILAIYGAAVFPFELLSTLTEEPALCPVLKTIALFDCDTNPDAMEKLGEALTRRRDLAAVRVYRVVLSTVPERCRIARRFNSYGSPFRVWKSGWMKRSRIYRSLCGRLMSDFQGHEIELVLARPTRSKRLRGDIVCEH